MRLGEAWTSVCQEPPRRTTLSRWTRDADGIVSRPHLQGEPVIAGLRRVGVQCFRGPGGAQGHTCGTRMAFEHSSNRATDIRVAMPHRSHRGCFVEPPGPERNQPERDAREIWPTPSEQSHGPQGGKHVALSGGCVTRRGRDSPPTRINIFQHHSFQSVLSEPFWGCWFNVYEQPSQSCVFGAGAPRPLTLSRRS